MSPASTQTPLQEPPAPAVSRPQRIILAAFVIGFTVLLGPYVTQGLLPALGRTFEISEAAASLSLSVTTFGIAVALIPMGILASRLGAIPVLLTGGAIAGVMALSFPWAPSFEAMLILRGIEGIALAAMPASILGMLAERLNGTDVAKGVGAYLAGNSLGGLSSRVCAGVLADQWGWQWAATIMGLLVVLGMITIYLLLRHEPRRLSHVPAADSSLAGVPTRRGVHRITAYFDNQLWRHYLIGALCMVVFGGSYTMLGTRLEVAPFFLSQTLVGAFFLIYLAGTLVSSQYGRIHKHLGTRASTVIGATLAILGAALTLPNNIPLIIVGFVLITAGFFTGHLGASHSVSSTPSPKPAIAAALYLTCYYIGASLGAWAAAQMYQAWAWPGVGALSAVAMIAVVLLTLTAAQVRAPRK